MNATTRTNATLIATNERVTINDVARGWFHITLADGSAKSVRKAELAIDGQTTPQPQETQAMNEQTPAPAEQEEIAPAGNDTPTPNEATEEAPKQRYDGPMLALVAAKVGYIKGKRSLICGDEISQALDGLLPVNKRLVAVRLSATTEKPVSATAWEGLNGGQIAMNAANAVRRLVKDGAATVAQVAELAAQILATQPAPKAKKAKAEAPAEQAA